MNQRRTFTHEGKSFEIRVAILHDRYCVRVFLNGAQVSPEYSAILEVGKNFFPAHKESIVNQLSSAAEADVRNGIYLKAGA